MGVADTEKQDEDASPNERLLWQTDHDDDMDMISPLVPRRGKKRARSSSPTSSSPATRTPAVNVKKLKKALKSAHTDPALDLWDRFAVNGPDTKSPLGATNPVLAHLMVSSSPRPSKDGASSHGEGGLRRAISCGAHWPKRRRVTEVASQSGPARDNKGTTKSSMVTALLQTVNGEINKTEEEVEEEEEEENIGLESPSIKKRWSPRKSRPSPQPIGLPQLSKHDIPAVTTNPPPTLEMTEVKTPTSDYGDDDFDDTTIWDELDASLLSGQAEAGSFSVAGKTPAANNVEGTRQQASSDDEFDDMDEDILAVAEDLIAEAAPRQAIQSTPTPAAKKVHIDYGTEESDDIYGDDFGGDFDFEAAETAATQSVDKAASPLLPVRTIR